MLTVLKFIIIKLYLKLILVLILLLKKKIEENGKEVNVNNISSDS